MLKKDHSFVRSLFAISLALVLIFSFAGCGGNTDDETAPTSTADSSAASSSQASATPAEDTTPATVKIITWSNPKTIEFLNSLNEKFTAKYPNLKVEINDVPSDKYDQLCDTRIAAKDLDIVTRSTGLSVPVPDWAKGAQKSKEVQWIEGGILQDIGAQDFVKSYSQSSIEQAGTYNGTVYGISAGRVSFGMLYNKDIFTKYNLKVPTVWSEFEALCNTLQQNKVTPMVMGQKDGWPHVLPREVLLDCMFAPDTLAYNQKLWTGEKKWTDPEGVATWARWSEFLTWQDKNFTGIAYESTPGMFAKGQVAMLPDGTWHAPDILALNPDANVGYFNIPWSDDASANNVLRGKYDLTFYVLSAAPSKEAAYKWLGFFSEKDNYTEFVNTTGFIPTQDGIQSTSKFLNEEIAPLFPTFKLVQEKQWFGPNNQANTYGWEFMAPMGKLTDPAKAAEGYQKDWDAAIKAGNK